MSSVASVADAAAELASTFCGELLKPADVGYEDARKVHNGLVDKRPALIARCRGVADVADAIDLTRKLGLEVAVRGGGHNVAGRATIDGGVMIDLAPMKGIHVDAKARTVRAQGGVTWGELNRETQLHGLATTGGVVASTGVAGLTLGGGLGWLMGKHGLALDNLVSVELVTAEGKVLRASKDDAPDLFWAVRGGGGNFGVATSLEYRLHPVGPMVTAGPIVHPIDRARDLLRFYRDSTASLPDEHTIFATLTHAPDGSGTKVAALVTCHCGSLADGERAMRPLKQFGSPVLDAVGPMPYVQLNGMLDAAYPKGALNYWKSNFLAELSDAAIDTMIACFARCPTPMGQLLLEHVHGAAVRVGVGDTAFPHRAEGYNFLVLSQWTDPSRLQHVHCVGARDLCRDAALHGVRPLRELPRRRRDRRVGGRRVRTQLPAAAGDQDQVRSEEFLPHEPEHPAVGLRLGRAMPLLYRPARAHDLQRAGELVVGSINDLCERHGFGPMAAVRPPDFSAFSLRDDPDGLWVAEDGGEILGFAFSWVCGDLWFLAQLFVSPGQQGRGIGQELLRRTLAARPDGERRHQGAHHLLLQQRIAGAVYSTRIVPALSDLQFQGRARGVDRAPASSAIAQCADREHGRPLSHPR